MNWNRLFFAALGLGLLLHVVTMGYSPLAWQDEVQVCEIGRLTLERSDWTVYWLPVSGVEKVPPLMWYVASVPQEWAYRLGGHTAVRLLPILLLALTSGLVWAYVHKRTSSPLLACLLGLLFFAYPSLTQSVRGARVDIWPFFYLFAALMLMRDSKRSFFVVGILTALCVFCWGTALVLVPILAWAAIDLMVRSRLSFRRSVTLCAMGVLGGLIGSVVVLSPLLAHFDVTLRVLEYVSHTTAPLRDHLLVTKTVSALFALPGLYALSLALMFTRKRMVLLLLGALAFLATWVLSQCYVFRSLYFLPFAIVAVAIFAEDVRSPLVKRGLVIVLSLMAMFAYGRSVVLRNALECFAMPCRDYDAMAEILASRIGRDARVYANTYQLYFAGRGLGWKMHRDFSIGGTVPVECLAQADWFIAEDNDSETSGVTDSARRSLEELDFEPCFKIPAQTGRLGPVASWINAHRRFAAVGPYVVYRRRR